MKFWHGLIILLSFALLGCAFFFYHNKPVSSSGSSDIHITTEQTAPAPEGPEIKVEMETTGISTDTAENNATAYSNFEHAIAELTELTE